MNCKTAKKLICIRMDGELSPREDALLGAHLAQCDYCRAEEAAVRRAMQIAGEWPDTEPRRGYDELLARLDHPEHARRRLDPVWRIPVPGWAAAALAVISLALGGAAGIRMQGPLVSPRPSEQQVLTAMDMGAFQAGDIIEASIHTAVGSPGAGR